MRQTILALITAVSALQASAQQDSTAFCAHLFNNEYEVFMRIDFYRQQIMVPDQELYGPLPGYLGKKHNSFCWVITSAKLKNQHTAQMSLINDYGSEDLTAQLTQLNDSTYQLRQLDGSALKVPKNGKWQKLPKVLEFKRRK